MIQYKTTPEIFVDEMLKTALAAQCIKQGFVDSADVEQFAEIALDNTALSLDEIQQALQDFKRYCSSETKQGKRYVLIDLESHSQQILPEHAVETAIRDLKPLKGGAVNCWICEEYIVIEQDLPKEQ